MSYQTLTKKIQVDTMLYVNYTSVRKRHKQSLEKYLLTGACLLLLFFGTLSLPYEEAWASLLEDETPCGAEMGLERKAEPCRS